jgi:hypothetical protein
MTIIIGQIYMLLQGWPTCLCTRATCINKIILRVKLSNRYFYTTKVIKKANS